VGGSFGRAAAARVKSRNDQDADFREGGALNHGAV